MGDNLSDRTDPIVEVEQAADGHYTYTDFDRDGLFDQVDATLLDGTSWNAVDLDGDGIVDRVAFDVNSDGKPELWVTRMPDGRYQVDVDDNGDGIVDESTIVTRAEFEDTFGIDSASVFDEMVPQPGSTTTFADPAPEQHQPVVIDVSTAFGDPDVDAALWFDQGVDGFCVPASVTQIISVYTGVVYDNPLELVELGNELGLWMVGEDGSFGMTVWGAHQLLTHHGIPSDVIQGDMNLLARMVEDYKIVAFVDSDVIWYSEAGDVADHAVVVTGVDIENGFVYLNDPGTPDGMMLAVPLAEFQEAWSTADYAMVTTTVTPEQFIAEQIVTLEGDPTQVGVDSEQGSFPRIPGFTVGPVPAADALSTEPGPNQMAGVIPLLLTGTGLVAAKTVLSQKQRLQLERNQHEH